MEQGKLKKKIIATLEYILSFFCCRIIAISEYERNHGLELGISAKKIVTIHNGISSEPPEHVPALWDDTRLKVLFVGRLDRQKGIDILLDAIASLENKVCARVVGTAVAGKDTVDFSRFPHVEALGWKIASEIAAQMAACDVVVMPSRWEGFGLVAIEAMRLFKPVIASNIGGLPEVIADGVTGALFPAGDVSALHQLLLSLTSSRLNEMGMAGRKRFLELFISDTMCRQINEVYQACLK